jgi:hypothetical protein
MVTEEQVWELDRRMKEALGREGVPILGSHYCFHHWEDRCLCRKPEPGMFHAASRISGSDWTVPGIWATIPGMPWRHGGRAVGVPTSARPQSSTRSMTKHGRQLVAADARMFAERLLHA